MPSRSIVMATHVVPYPPSAGNEIRIYRLLLWLRSQGYQVHLLIRKLEPVAVPTASLRALREITADTEDLTLATRGASARVRSVLNKVGRRISAWGGRPRPRTDPLEDSFCPPAFFRKIREVCRAVRPDAFIAQYIFMTRGFAAAGRDTLKIVDCHDVFSRKQERVLAYGIDDGLALTVAEESPLLARADVILAIQGEERTALQQMLPEKSVITVGIDFEIRDDAGTEAAEDDRLLFVASDNRMNNRGIEVFLERDWPIIRQARPGARLRIIGSVRPGNRLPPGVERVGFVPDLAQEYRRASVVINPVEAGTGLKIKTVEALCWAKPLVAYPHGVEGIPITSPPAFLAADRPGLFAAEVLRALQSPALRRELSVQAARLVREHFSTDAVYRELGQALARSAGGGARPAPGADLT